MRITRPPLPTLDDVAPPLYRGLPPTPPTFSPRCRRCKSDAAPDDEGRCSCGGEVDFVPEG